MAVYDWSPPYAAAVYLGAGLGLLLCLLLARRLSRSTAARRWSLMILRAAVLGGLVFILLNLVQVTEARLPARQPEFVYLIDCSQSMALDRPVSRIDQVKAAIRKADDLLPADRPHVSLYRFGSRLVACNSPDELSPADDRTQLREALEQLPARLHDGRPAGVVVFSDGRTPGGGDLEALAAGYRTLGLPLHVFPVGDPTTSGDVAIEDVLAPRDAPAGARIPIRVLLRTHGFPGRRVELRIRGESSSKGQVLAMLPLTLEEGTKSHELLIDQDPGAERLVAEVTPLPGEAVLGNNQVAFQIRSRKRKTRVLYMEGTPSNEYRWVRDALVEDPDIECVAMEVNNQYAARQMLYRVDDPRRGYPTTREELFGFDVVICSDISRNAFTQEQLDWTVELVRNRGGGFAMVGGNTSFGAGFWDQTVWDGLIPVDMGAEVNFPTRGTSWNTDFKVKVPPEVERHPIWRLADDPAENRRIIASMPRFTGCNLISRLKPAATVLGLTDRPMPQVGVMPVFSCEPFGQGRTFAMAPDTTVDWGLFFERDWGENGDNRYFRKFWRNVVLWLGENSAGNRRLRVDTDKILYRPGQPIKVAARAFDDRREETTRYRLVTCLRDGGPRAGGGPAPKLAEGSLAPRTSEGGYEGVLAAPPVTPARPGQPASTTRTAALEVLAYDGTDIVAQTTLDVQVTDDPAEFVDPRPDAARLESLARASGGQVLHDGKELAAVLRGATAAEGEVVVQKVPLWDHPALWGLLLALLTAEWCLRRWWGLA
jgi:uncharacterized membrane protein